MIFSIFICFYVFGPLERTPKGLKNRIMNIEEYNEQLKQLCACCRKSNKCNHEKKCTLKKLAWMLAVTKLKKEGTNGNR